MNTENVPGQGVLPAELESTLSGFMLSSVVFAGHSTGLFDVIAVESGLDALEAARAANLHPAATQRFLVAAAGLGLVERDGGRFRLPDRLAPFLSRRGAQYLGGWIQHLELVTRRSLERLPDALRTGDVQLPHAVAGADGDVFAALYADPERVRAFADSMWNLSRGPSHELAALAPLADRRTLVDLGGGSGAFAFAAAERYSALRGVVVDLPALRPHFQKRAEQLDLAARVEFCSADMFRDPLPPGDAYALGFVLSDWSRARGIELLERVHAALPPGGVVLICERLFDEDQRGPLATALMDMCMMVETGGQHRAASEYIAWLEHVGFVGCTLVRTSGSKHLIYGARGGTDPNAIGAGLRSQ